MRSLVGGVVLVVAIVAGCGGAAASIMPAGHGPIVEPTRPPHRTPAPSRTPASSATAPAGSGAAVDPSLLAILPATVDGLDVQHLPEYDAIVATDPQVRRSAERFVTAFVADPASGDFATGPLIRLRPGVMSDAFFRDWRDSFDEGACSQASGVAGHAETAIGGRDVFITSCAGGARVYHVWLAERGVLVSINSGGERGLGEKLVAALRE